MRLHLLFILISFSHQLTFSQNPYNNLVFNGQGYVTITNAHSLNPAGDFSVEVWFKSRVITESQGIVTKLEEPNLHSFTGGGWNIQVGTLLNIAVTAIDDQGNSDYLNTTWEPQPNTWYHVAFVHNAGTNRNSLYVNGVLEAAKIMAVSFTNNPLQFGKFFTNSELLPFIGQIDEFRYWSRALTESDIRANMCKKIKSTSTNLLAYYRFDENKSATLPDLTQEQHHGKLINLDAITAWTTSDAPIGIRSIYTYFPIPSWDGKTLELTTIEDGNLTINGVTGTPDGVHIFLRQDGSTADEELGKGTGSNETFYGTFVVNGNQPTYTVDYYYGNSSDAVANEDNLSLLSRNNNSTWEDTEATQDIQNQLFSKSGFQTSKEFALKTTLAPLPVELIYFTAKKNDNHVKLSWATASEKNNDYFLIQQSVDGISWTTITKIESAGNSTLMKSYNYTDTPLLNGTIYYRLQQTDLNGDMSFSKIISVRIESKKANITVYPNPAYLKLNVKAIDGTKINNIILYNSMGKIVAQNNKNATSIDVSQLPAGIYFISIESNKERILNEIVIR